LLDCTMSSNSNVESDSRIALEMYSDVDKASGFEVLDGFQRFEQKDDVFRRSWWDERIRNEKTERFYNTYREPLENWRNADGFSQKDYALRNAAWHVSDVFTELKVEDDRREGFSDTFSIYQDIASEKQAFNSLGAAAQEIKRVSKAFGADMVGIAEYDERWTYANKFSDMSSTERPSEVPEGTTHVVVIAQAMDYDLIRTVPSALSGAATGLGYSQDAMVVLSIAQYIRNLGYGAVASMNDTSLAIPTAIQAGLGEYGRNGLLITQDFGPRVRLGKIFTNLPMTPDKPVSFGVKEFCNDCRRCADGCPVKAIPQDDAIVDGYNQSNIKHVRKWTVDGEKCFSYWTAQNSDCSICIRVCPYNKDYSKWWNKLGIRLASTPLRKVMLWLDKRLGFGKRMRPSKWWQSS